MRKYYSPSLKAWVGDLGDGVHNGGPEDPRIAIIRVQARTATYALAVGTSVGRGVELVKGALTGQAPEVNKLRELNEEELGECKLFAPYIILPIHLSLLFWSTISQFRISNTPCLQFRALTIFTRRA